MDGSKTQQPGPDRRETSRWQAPAIEWEENYEPVVFAVSCAQQPLNCGGAAQN